MFPRDPQEPKLIAWLRNARVRRLLILVSLWMCIATTLVWFRFVLLPFAIAVLLAFIIEPIVERLSSGSVAGWKMSRAFAVVLIYAVTIAGFSLFGTWGIGQIGRELSKVGSVSANILHEVEAMSDQLIDGIVDFAERNSLPIGREELTPVLHQNLNSFGEMFSKHSANVFQLGRDIVTGAVHAIFGAFLVLMLTAVLAIDRARIQRFFFTLVPPEYRSSYTVVIGGMSAGLAGVVRGQVMICLTNGFLTFVGLWLFGVKLPLLLASIAMVFSLIPIFGSILSTIPIVAIALTDSFSKGLITLAWIIAIHLAEANVLNPKIMGDAAKIHPVIVVFALIVGERTSGLIGALFAVPIASVLLTLFKFLHLRALTDVREAVRQGSLPEATGDLQTADLPVIALGVEAATPTPTILGEAPPAQAQE